MIKAITFDLDGVYFVKGKESFIKALGDLGVSEDEAKRVFLKSDEMNELYKRGKMTDEEYWTWAAKEWGLDKSPEELVDLLMVGYEVDEGVVSIVKKVREQGYKTLVCSNNFPARIEGLNKRFGFLDNFDVVVLSYEVGATKPASIIFEELIEKSGVKADEIVYADDQEVKLQGAKDLGVHTFVFEDFNQFTDQLRGLGVEI